MYHKPSAVFTLHEGNYVGSLRAPLGIDLVKILDACSPYLARYGGHAGAAGCTIQESSMLDASRAFQDAMRALYSDHDSTPVLRIDTVLDMYRLNLEMLHSLDTLRPFGQEFPAPLFLLRDIMAPVVSLGQTGEHIRWDVSEKIEIVGFRMGEYRTQLQDRPTHLIGTLKSHTWRDTTTLQFHVLDAILLE